MVISSVGALVWSLVHSTTTIWMEVTKTGKMESVKNGTLHSPTTTTGLKYQPRNPTKTLHHYHQQLEIFIGEYVTEYVLCQWCKKLVKGLERGGSFGNKLDGIASHLVVDERLVYIDHD